MKYNPIKGQSLISRDSLNTGELQHRYRLTHQDTSKYINCNSTLHATQRCGPGRVFLFIKEFIYRNLRTVRRWYLFYTNRHDNLATSCSQNRKGSSKEEPFLLPCLITNIHIWEGRIMACIYNIIQKIMRINFVQIECGL